MISLPLGAEEAVAEEVVAVVIEVVEAVASEGAEASEEAEVVIEVAEVVAVEATEEAVEVEVASVDVVDSLRVLLLPLSIALPSLTFAKTI